MRCGRREGRAGVTLVELLVVLTLLGLLAGMAGVAVTALRPRPEDAPRAALRAARLDALRTGEERVLELRLPEAATGDTLRLSLRLLPDGRVLGPGVDPWTGELLTDSSTAGR